MRKPGRLSRNSQVVGAGKASSREHGPESSGFPPSMASNVAFNLTSGRQSQRYTDGAEGRRPPYACELLLYTYGDQLVLVCPGLS